MFYLKYESRNFKKYLFLCLNMLAVQLTLLLLAFFIPEVSPPEKVCIQVPSRYIDPFGFEMAEIFLSKGCVKRTLY